MWQYYMAAGVPPWLRIKIESSSARPSVATSEVGESRFIPPGHIYAANKELNYHQALCTPVHVSAGG